MWRPEKKHHTQCLFSELLYLKGAGIFTVTSFKAASHILNGAGLVAHRPGNQEKAGESCEHSVMLAT